MEIALFAVLMLAAMDLLTCVLLLSVVWVEYRRVRREAAAAGEPLPSADGQIGCLLAFCSAGVVALVLSAWLLLRE